MFVFHRMICRKERPNQREFQIKNDDQKDIWRHDKFEELVATERYIPWSICLMHIKTA